MKIVTSRGWWTEKKGVTAFLHDGTRCKVFEDTKRPIYAGCDYWLVPIIEVGEDDAPIRILATDAYMVRAERISDGEGNLYCLCPRFGRAYRHWWPGQPEVSYAIVDL